MALIPGIVQQGGANPETSDWSTWDGTQDGDLGILVAPMRGTMGMAPVEGDSTKMVVAYGHGDPTIILAAAVVTRTGVTAALSGQISVDEITGGITYPLVVALSSSRYLVAGRQVSDQKLGVHLLNLSGNTLTVVDSAVYDAPTVNWEQSIAMLTPSLVSIVASDVDTSDLWMFTVSIAGDVITINDPVEIRDAVTANTTNAVCRLTNTSGLLSSRNLVQLFTISGATPSAGDTELLVGAEAGTANNSPLGLIRISDTKAIAVYNHTTAGLGAKVITNTAGTLSSGTQYELIASGVYTWGIRVSALSANHYLVAYDTITSTVGGYALVFHHNPATDAITLIDTNLMVSDPAVDTDHPNGAAFSGGNYALVVNQDDQINVYNAAYKVLHSE